MTGPDDDRRWWREWLRTAPDPEGCWRLGPVRRHTAAGPAGTVQELTVASFGDELTAELFRPDGATGAVVVVPFYETSTVLGSPAPRTRHSGRSAWSQAHGLHLARRGLSVLAVPWWFEQVAAGDPRTAEARDLAERYAPAAARHARTLPGTALGRSVADLMLTVTAALEEGLARLGALGAFGHSLGGKLALHLAALDPRVDAAAAHEPGLGLAHSNWDAPWYLGTHLPPDRDQDELLALVAPRAFLLAGGGSSDGAHNRHLAERAATRWPDPADLVVLHHGGGHPLPEHVTAAVAGWLDERLS